MIVHQRLSYPGRVAQKLMAKGYPLDIRCPNIGHALPEDLEKYAAVYMFGGPMCALDCHIPAIRKELDWMPKIFEADKTFVGICLGAQMLARMLGARVWPHPEGRVEIGYTTIFPTDAGRNLFDGPMKMFQWHRDGFDLPRGTELLATSEHFPQQAFRYGSKAYGIQFHPEVTPEIMQRWSVGGGHMLHLPGAQSREEQLAEFPKIDPFMDAWTDRFLARVMEDRVKEEAADNGAASTIHSAKPRASVNIAA